MKAILEHSIYSLSLLIIYIGSALLNKSDLQLLIFPSFESADTWPMSQKQKLKQLICTCGTVLHKFPGKNM
jgi:hypothetical protein